MCASLGDEVLSMHVLSASVDGLPSQMMHIVSQHTNINWCGEVGAVPSPPHTNSHTDTHTAAFLPFLHGATSTPWLADRLEMKLVSMVVVVIAASAKAQVRPVHTCYSPAHTPTQTTHLTSSSLLPTPTPTSLHAPAWPPHAIAVAITCLT